MSMTDDDKLTMLKAMVGENDSDTVLSTYLTLAGRKIIAKAYPYNTDVTEVPAQYDTLQVEVAAYMLNKRGAEGQLSHTENSVTRTYETGDIPSSLLRTVTPYCGAISASTSSTDDEDSTSEDTSSFKSADFIGKYSQDT